MRRNSAALAIVGILLASCAGSGTTVIGSIIEVSGDLVQVDSFTVLSEGVAHTFIPEEGGAFSIPLPHLRDHLRSAEAVEVTFFEADGVLIASDVTDVDPHR